MKKSLLGLTFASLMFSAGSAVAADYKIDKEGQHAFVKLLPLMKKIQLPIK